MNFLKSYQLGCVTVSSLLIASSAFAADGTVKIGLDIALSGHTSTLNINAAKGVKLASDIVNSKGGVKIGGKAYTIELINYDNKDDKTTAAKLALKAIQRDKVLAMVPPATTDMAVQVTRVTNSLRIPSVAANASSTKITKNRPYSFKVVSNFPAMIKATVQLANQEWNAKKAAVLFNEYNSYGVDLASVFKTEFTQQHGEDSVVAFESFQGNHAKDIDQQVASIVESDADFLYAPLYSLEVATLTEKLRNKGWNKPVTGPSSWHFPELLAECGQTHCNGLYFTTNFTADKAEGKMLDFVNMYQKHYNQPPEDESAAAGYDALTVIIKGLEKMDSLSGNIMEDRKKLRDAIATVQYDGVTAGKIAYQKSGDNIGEPNKCVVIAKMDGDKYTKHSIICP